MAESESVLDAIFEDDGDAGETLDDYGDDNDVDMVDAAPLEAVASQLPSHGGDGSNKDVSGSGIGGKSQRRRANKKKNKKRRNSGLAPNITDINRFVIDTCRRLKEKKSYLIWNAVGCLGVSAVSELVKEVEAVQRCGGQKTADGKRFRMGGGILWNILKTREPNVYKEIMAKGKEFEKQFRQPKRAQKVEDKEEGISECRTQASIDGAGEVLNYSEPKPKAQDKPEASKPSNGRISALDRIRVPIVYDDLLEEGEIQE
ncbi:phosphorylated adapter RNA export protein [Dioscorea alata]|uniref:Phosphorylated adapter RNA export protein n=1 Tax=Dioscorea alata TaxID=55571 RepID=A0ACB7WEP1_DIOAL|nr:phosphorylated adapter RNA export protein [Dioscorea alata]